MNEIWEVLAAVLLCGFLFCLPQVALVCFSFRELERKLEKEGASPEKIEKEMDQAALRMYEAMNFFER